MSWSDYVVFAAKHSKNSAQHWFRYLRKFIDKCDIWFTSEELAALCENTALSPFQRVSLKAAFTEGSPTRQHVIRLNSKVVPTKLALMRAKYEKKK
jgi:hypothetical protein